MSRIPVTITIKETNEQIQDKIIKTIRDELNSRFPSAINEIEATIKTMIFGAITTQPEYQSISNGTLRIELGLPDGQNRLLQVIDIWLQSVKATFKKFRASQKSGLTGGIIIEAIEADYTDVLSLPEAIFVTEKDDELLWLQWMLKEGSGIIISDYRVEFIQGKGRTGGGIMVQPGSWGIPFEFAGTPNDNFVTRALNEIQPEMERELTRIIEDLF